MESENIQRVDRDDVSPRTRRLYMQASLIAVLGNVLLLMAKGVAAWISSSSAIYADAANSASDVAYSLLMGLGLWFSLRPPDTTHPHGHRRAEPLVSLVIGGAMAFAGVEALRSGLDAWRTGARPALALWPVIVLVGTALIKTAMFLRVRRLGEESNSPALMASARDNLSDIISSATALVGLILSQVYRVADPIAAFIVALWIFRNARHVLGTSIHQLIGGGASAELHDDIVQVVSRVPGVLGIQRIVIEHAGPQVYVDIHIQMPGASRLDEVHHVSHAVRNAVQAIDEVNHVFVHVEPIEKARRAGGHHH